MDGAFMSLTLRMPSAQRNSIEPVRYDFPEAFLPPLRPMRESSSHCAHCGEPIAANARFCRHCGSSDEDGWGDSDESLLDDDFDYDTFVEDEFSARRTTRLHPVWKIAAVLLLLGFVLTLLQVAL